MAAPSSTPTATTEPHVVEDCRGVLKLMSDGSVIRSSGPAFPLTFPDDGSVEWKDLLFDPMHSLHVRLYRPVRTPPNTKLPILVFFHGGGFCLGSCTEPTFHASCRRLSAELPALVFSFDYRLAPEHRLPAAIEDAGTALLWLKSQCTGPDSDAWFAENGDFTKVFISGESAGGNLTHHMAVRFGPDGLNPVKILGFILIVPAMMAEELTRSELECPKDYYLNREVCDKYARLAFPVGANKDNPALNLFGPESPNLEKVEMGPMLVVTAERDILIDRNVDYVKKLKEMGKKVEMIHIAGEEHPFFSMKAQSEPVGEVIKAIRRFMDQAGGGSD